MIDREKRRTVQVLGTGLTAIAGLTATPVTANTSTDTTRAKGLEQAKMTRRGDIQEPGQLFSTGLLVGENEVSPVESDGQGIAVFRASPDQSRLDYALLAINTTTPITAAHIHIGSKEKNGPVVTHLLGEQADAHQSIVQNNAVAAGTLTADDLVGPCKDKSIADLLKEIEASNAYVNVHTTKCQDGELRDQLCAIKELDVCLCANIHATSNSGIEITGSGELEIDLVKETKEDGNDEC